MLEIIASILAGLGLYFMGMGAIKSNLQRIPGRRFREFIGHATKIPALGALLGFMMGVITQTSIGVTVIFAGLISRGVATIPQALPVIAWSNVGLVVLVYLAHQPLHIIALFLIGICGIYMNFFHSGKISAIFEPFFSLGLVLLGIRLMKVNCPALAASHEAAAFFAMIPNWNLLALAFGALARTVIQSTSTCVILGLIMNAAGIFTNDQALMVIFGTGLGTGLATHFLTSYFKGVMRQITLFEAAINVAAGLTMVLFFYLEKSSRYPMLTKLVDGMPGAKDEYGHIASYFLIQQTFCLIYTYATLPWMPRWLEWASPTTKEQDLSRPRFISSEAAQDFETGRALAEQELGGLMQRMPGYLQTVRTDHTEQALAEPVVLHNSSRAVITELEAFLTELSEQAHKSHGTSVALLQAQRRLTLVAEIDDCVWQIVQAFRGLPPTGPLSSVEGNIIEALDALLHTGIDAMTSLAPDDIEMLGLITAAPGDVVDRLRRNYLRQEQTLDHHERILILSVLSQYERIVWSLQQLSRSLQAGLVTQSQSNAPTNTAPVDITPGIG